MPGNRHLLNLAAVLFGVIIIFGEAFKLNLGFVKISFPLLLIIITALFALKKRLKIYTTFLDNTVLIFGVVFLLFSVVGVIVGNSVPDISEDLYPILSFVGLFIIWRSSTAEDINWLWKKIILFAIIAAFKVVLIAIVPFEVLWDNNWQATKEPLPFNIFYRIILRGGDIFLSFALAHFILRVQKKGRTNLGANVFLILLFAFAVFISLSRSSYLGLIVAVILTLALFHRYFSSRKLAVFCISMGAFLLATLPFFNTLSMASSIFEARVEAFDANDVAVDFRNDERSVVYEKASNAYYLGNGLGSYFYIDLSGSDKKDDRSIYVHDVNAWLIFKTGILGLLLFYVIFFRSTFNLFQTLSSMAKKGTVDTNLTVLSLFSAGIVLIIISFLANKISTISGSVFFAFYAASSVVFKKHYESRL